MKKTIVFLAVTVSLALANTADEKEVQRIDNEIAQVQQEYNAKRQALYEEYKADEKKIMQRYQPKLDALQEQRRIAKGEPKKDINKWIEEYAKESERIRKQGDSWGGLLWKD